MPPPYQTKAHHTFSGYESSEDESADFTKRRASIARRKSGECGVTETCNNHIKPDVVARMSSGPVDGDSDENKDEGGAGMYGYVTNTGTSCKNLAPSHRRRSSTGRRSSLGSTKSRRRSHIHSGKDPLASYLSSDEDDLGSDFEDEPSRLHHSGIASEVPQSAFGYESESEHSHKSAEQSICSSKRSKTRRNSCISKPALTNGAISDEELEKCDPDSLLNRARNNLKAKQDAQSEDSEKEDEDLLFENKRVPPTTTPAPPPVNTTVETPFRKDPLTTIYTAPTLENIRLNDGWGNLGFPGDEYEEEFPVAKHDSDDESYGANMYTESRVAAVIDKYKQKARRRASLENTCMAIGTNLSTNKIDFRAAVGCTNASDFVVRCFSARLRTTGFTVLKHNRSRWSKAKHRVIYLLPDGKTLSWRLPDDETGGISGGKIAQNQIARRPKIVLADCKEVRHAWSPDPSSKNKRGTAVVRARCKEGLAQKSFSLIFGKRTLDFTAFSNDQCKVLMEGFSALCYRLKLQREEDDQSSHSFSKHVTEAEWCSTLYGGSTSPSVTNTAHSIPARTPWGY